MKNIKNIVRATLLGFVLVACSTDLDINPVQYVDVSQSLLTAKDVKATLIGAYSNLGSSNLYGGGALVYPDLLASSGNDINFFGTFQGLAQISNKQIPINNDFVTSFWLDAYTAINTANEVLNSLMLLDAQDRDQAEGEAKFIRGSVYFELVKVFGRAWNDGDPTTNPGVPIVLKPTHTIEDALVKVGRSTVEQVYNQVISDLSDAEALLPTPNNVGYYYATTGAAAAQLSRVYLIQSDYARARDAANRVISSGFYKLAATYAEEFPYYGKGVRVPNTPEDIFALQISEQQGFNNLNNYYANSDKGGRGDIEVPVDFLNEYEPGDNRLTLFEDDGSEEYFYTNKFDNVFGNVKILRLAEMYLTRAECNVRLGTTVGDSPDNDINIVRHRVGLDPLSNATVDQILKERFLELAFEGQWLFDYKRTATSNPNWVDPNGNVPTWDSPQMVYPIPQRERILNHDLEQNVGYE